MVEIALSSSDRRMKVTACELLQAVCLLMLGNAAKGPMRRRGEESQSVRFLSMKEFDHQKPQSFSLHFKIMYI